MNRNVELKQDTNCMNEIINSQYSRELYCEISVP